MHFDRAAQFSKRLGWDVIVDENGEEHDEYDALNPLYVIVENKNGEHEGSLRFLPTTGRTMVNDHFIHITEGVKIESPHIWECTRFCVSPNADRHNAAKLLAAGAYLMRECCIDHFIGVFDDRMERIYRAVGAKPTVLGRQSTPDGTIGVGLWEFDDARYQHLLTKASLTSLELGWCYESSDAFFTPTINIGHSLPDDPPQLELSSDMFRKAEERNGKQVNRYGFSGGSNSRKDWSYGKVQQSKPLFT